MAAYTERLILAISAGPEVDEEPRHSNGSKLSVPTHNFLRKGCGLDYSLAGRYYTNVEGQPIEIAEFKGADIPKIVSEARTKLSTVVGIVGLDHVLNSPSGQLNQVEIVRKLGFGRCDFQLGVREGYGSETSTLEDVAGLRIATALPILAQRIFRERGVGVGLVPMDGHVEQAIRYGLADAIIDITITGGTMRRYGLIPAEKPLPEPFVAVLIANRDQFSDSVRQRQINRFVTRYIDKALRNPTTWSNVEGNGHGSDDILTNSAPAFVTA